MALRRTEYGYAGSYWTFLRQVRPLRPAVVREAVVRFKALPGVQIQADWKHLGLWSLGEELLELDAMVAILGRSRRPAIRIASSGTREVSFERLVRCLDGLGGVTRDRITLESDDLEILERGRYFNVRRKVDALRCAAARAPFLEHPRSAGVALCPWGGYVVDAVVLEDRSLVRAAARSRRCLEPRKRRARWV